MSIWGDLRKRSSGEIIRREDKYNTKDICEFSDAISQPITFAGNIDESVLPAGVSAGQIFFTNDDVIINGVTYHAGTMLLYDGTSWCDMGSFTHQRVDSNIGYYQPDSIQVDSRF